MNPDLAARAKAALEDLAYEMATGDVSRVLPSGPTTPTSSPVVTPKGTSGWFNKQAEYMARRWEEEKLLEWRAAGRITEEGYLRVSRVTPAPYTLTDIMRTMPHLGVFDRLAVLIDLNGVVEEDYLSGKEHEVIREVVERIADDRLARRLQDPDQILVLRDIVRQEIAAVFDELRTRVNSPTSTLSGGKGRQMKCSLCRQPGHRATTCGRKKDALPVDEDLKNKPDAYA